MRLVIDISKDRYDEIMSMDWKNCRLLFDEEIRAIHDGKVLEQEPCGNCISRDKAIVQLRRFLSDSDDDWNVAIRKCIEDIKKLPSVTQQPCEDAISRQAVLDYIYNDLGLSDEENGKDVERQLELESSYRFVKSLPPVTPMPKMGKWIYRKEEDSYRCSLCTFPCHKDNMGAIPTRYCAECGAYMQEAEE